MSRTNIQIPPVLQYHTPKMRFPSLPIQSFMETVARIIPVWFFFPPWGFVLSMWRWSAGEAGIRQPEGRVGNYRQCLWGKEGEQWLCSCTLFPHTSASLSPAEVPSLCHTPSLHGRSCRVTQSHPPLPSHLVFCASASHCQQACVASYCCCLADKHEEEKRQNVDLSQNSNAWGTFLAKSVNKQINKLFFPPYFGSKKTCHSIQKECSLSIFSKFNRNKQWE